MPPLHVIIILSWQDYKISPHEMSPHEMSPHEMSPHEMSPHEMSPHEISPHEMSPHGIVYPNHSTVGQSHAVSSLS